MIETPTTKRAILFMNLGGPENLDQVKPFLYRLFVDPEIIRVKFTPLRMFIAWAISTAREKKSRDLYAGIGGGSPIRKLTDQQARETEHKLRGEGKDVYVRTAFTCSDPLVEDVVKHLAERGVEKFLAFPLYPQYSLTTTKGSHDRSVAAVKKLAPKATLDQIRSWPTHPLFLKAHADLIRQAVATLPDKSESNTHLLFSAHSIPEKLVTEEGDPYKTEMEQSVKGVIEELGWKGPSSLAWQSRLGPVKWLEPSTVDSLHELGSQKMKQVVVIPIAFVTDHIETLSEIDIEFKEEAEKAGITEFRRTPGLNNHPLFIQALTDIARSHPTFWL